MKNNVFLFTWEDRFLALKDLKKWKTAFITKYWAENVFEFKSDNFDSWDILNAIFSWWLFVTKKLVIVHWFPKDSSSDLKISEAKIKPFEEKLLQMFDTISDDCILIFVSFSPDKRTKFYKFLSTNASQKTYDKLNKPWLSSFVKETFWSELDKEIVDYIINLVWTDMFSLYNESYKLKFYVDYNKTKLTKKIIDDVVFSQSSINAFDILDNIFVNKSAALEIIRSLQSKWYEEFQFLWMLQWWTKALINIMDCVSLWMENDSKWIASKLGLHPFVVAKNLSSAKRLLWTSYKIKDFFKKLMEMDYSIKTWRLPIELFWLEIKKEIISL